MDKELQRRETTYRKVLLRKNTETNLRRLEATGRTKNARPALTAQCVIWVKTVRSSTGYYTSMEDLIVGLANRSYHIRTSFS